MGELSRTAFIAIPTGIKKKLRIYLKTKSSRDMKMY